jgi:hypothetical protein
MAIGGGWGKEGLEEGDAVLDVVGAGESLAVGGVGEEQEEAGLYGADGIGKTAFLGFGRQPENLPIKQRILESRCFKVVPPFEQDLKISQFLSTLLFYN